MEHRRRLAVDNHAEAAGSRTEFVGRSLSTAAADSRCWETDEDELRRELLGGRSTAGRIRKNSLFSDFA